MHKYPSWKLANVTAKGAVSTSWLRDNIPTRAGAVHLRHIKKFKCKISSIWVFIFNLSASSKQMEVSTLTSSQSSLTWPLLPGAPSHIFISTWTSLSCHLLFNDPKVKLEWYTMMKKEKNKLTKSSLCHLLKWDVAESSFKTNQIVINSLLRANSYGSCFFPPWPLSQESLVSCLTLYKDYKRLNLWFLILRYINKVNFTSPINLPITVCSCQILRTFTNIWQKYILYSWRLVYLHVRLNKLECNVKLTLFNYFNSNSETHTCIQIDYTQKEGKK